MGVGGGVKAHSFRLAKVKYHFLIDSNFPVGMAFSDKL